MDEIREELNWLYQQTLTEGNLRIDEDEIVELEPDDTTLALADVLDKLAFDQYGLMPAVAQDAHTGQVLMLA